MKQRNVLLVAGLLQALLASPAWAHPGSGPHVHGESLAPGVALGIALLALLLQRRSRSSIR